MWRPGADVEQFRPLAGPMRLTWIGPEHLTMRGSITASPDPDATELVRAAVTHLREDLQRNAPEVAKRLDRSWDELVELTVCVAPDLVCRVELPGTDDVVHVPVEAGVDWTSGTLHVRDLSAVKRPSVVGSSIAARFPGSRREAALAWAAACDRAEQGRTAVRLDLSEDRARRDQEAAAAERERRLRELWEEAERRRGTNGTGKHATAGSRQAVDGRAPAPRPSGPGRRPSAPTGRPAPSPRRLVDPSTLRLAGHRGDLTSARRASDRESDAAARKGQSGLPQPRSGSAVPQQRTAASPYTIAEQEKIALDLVRQALASDESALRDLRAQHGLGADAVDELARFFELKTSRGAEPDTVTLTPAEFQRAAESDDFFLVVVSGLEAGGAPITVRIIPQPLKHLPCRPSGNVMVSGIRSAQSLVYSFESGE